MTVSENCIFCRIARRDIHGHEIYRDELVVAFLDISPIRTGHTQIVPIEHYPYFDNLPADVGARIFNVGQKIARVMKQLYAVDRVAFCFTGGDIPHAHAHIVPIHEMTDITSARYIVEPNVTFQALPFAPKETLVEEAQALTKALAKAK